MSKTDLVAELIITHYEQPEVIGIDPATHSRKFAEALVERGYVEGPSGSVTVMVQRILARNRPTRVVVASDFHFPFEHKRLVENWLRFVADAQPDVVVVNGDGMDFEGISRYAKKPGGPSFQNELDAFEGFLSRVADACPNAERHFTLGNHEERLERWLLENPAFYDLRCLRLVELLHLDAYGFQLHDYEVPLDIGKLSIVHGKYTQMYAAKAHLYKEGYDNVVHGHVHRQQFWCESGHGGTKRAWSTGCMCDFDAMDYIRGPKQWQHGFGIFEVFGEHVHGVLVEATPEGMFIADGRVYQ